MNVLISLYKGYGLGDGVQVSSVLRHVAEARPDWRIYYQAEEGRHQVGRGIVFDTFAYGESYPSPYYDQEVQICLYDTWANWGDRPNTRVSSCLHEVFGLPWKPELGRYKVNVSSNVAEDAKLFTQPGYRGPPVYRHMKQSRVVAFHYQGDSSPDKKNLTHEQAIRICEEVEKLGCRPLLLDWRNTSPIVDEQTISTTGRTPASGKWGRDAEMNCAIIGQCAAFVGIDSGPSKCASATDTPSLVIWTGHHPAPFHDPASNTTHLVPRGYHGLEPVCNDSGVIQWFEEQYRVRQYDADPIIEVAAWLKETLT